MKRLDLPNGFELWETQAAYERRSREHRGPYELDRCFVCDRLIGTGEQCLGMRIDNPSGVIQVLAGPLEERPNGSHFPIHVGVKCLKKAIKEWNN